jgi:hypothetical protein
MAFLGTFLPLPKEEAMVGQPPLYLDKTELENREMALAV